MQILPEHYRWIDPDHFEEEFDEQSLHDRMHAITRQEILGAGHAGLGFAGALAEIGLPRKRTDASGLYPKAGLRSAHL